jgi:hypothetical protein
MVRRKMVAISWMARSKLSGQSTKGDFERVDTSAGGEGLEVNVGLNRAGAVCCEE